MSTSDTELMRELDEACSHADEIIRHIQKRLDQSPPMPERAEYLVMHVREVRRQRAQALFAAHRGKALPAQREEQRREVVLLMRKATLTIRLQVTRLAGILESMLEPRH
jgi:hypothetical protein